MMIRSVSSFIVKAALAVSLTSLVHLACAQPASDAAQATSKPTKAQRKAARKEARARKNAELKKLEQNGYNPAARSDLNYPQDLQKAQRKAAAGQAASQ
ncbi:hypothetical protein SAMN05443245_7691 [Paraburkholderia fungorum]|uniref:DUF4148 domain-containing protein n=1 Tax=Paraburkholderia fungorum TaxID=134537 RepID=A0A1H1JZR2_9BURK|nr:DUF4148 domain-containing protein [Paraburkholderia fungorum]SDR55454.1 hypothetical protein SAMN05443245_7691 [Paraburkholderia fungorum]